MNETHPGPVIRIYPVDGSVQSIPQNDPCLVDLILKDLHPNTLFSQDRATIVYDKAEVTLVLPLITRIDLVTDRLSVWDFPFVLGAPVELTEAEFGNGLLSLEGWERPRSTNATPVFLDLEMVDGQRVFLEMEIVAGLSMAHLSRIHSLLKEPRLIFGLRSGGIGILNLRNLARFSLHPEPEDATANASGHGAERARLRLQARGANGGSANHFENKYP
jgi:hypothetical protein